LNLVTKTHYLISNFLPLMMSGVSIYFDINHWESVFSKNQRISKIELKTWIFLPWHIETGFRIQRLSLPFISYWGYCSLRSYKTPLILDFKPLIFVFNCFSVDFLIYTCYDFPNFSITGLKLILSQRTYYYYYDASPAVRMLYLLSIDSFWS